MRERVQETIVASFFILKCLGGLLARPLTSWKLAKYRLISGPYSPAFGLNTGKYGPEITSYLDTFHSVSGISTRLKCEVWNGSCEMWSVKWVMWNVKCEMGHVKCLTPGLLSKLSAVFRCYNCAINWIIIFSVVLGIRCHN